MTLFAGKFRAESHRLPGWNYANAAVYFITLVMENRACILGEISGGEMYLSDFGRIVEEAFGKSFEIRKELILHDYVIMPNHLHALVEIIPVNSVDSDGRPYQPKFIPNYDSEKKMPIRQPKSISSFVAGFKSATVKMIDDFIDEKGLKIPKYNRFNRLWQNNYNDIIVRNESSFWNIKRYIQNNPQNWVEDNLRGSDSEK